MLLIIKVKKTLFYRLRESCPRRVEAVRWKEEQKRRRAACREGKKSLNTQTKSQQVLLFHNDEVKKLANHRSDLTSAVSKIISTSMESFVVIISPASVILIKQICINHFPLPSTVLLFVIKFRFGMKANWRTMSNTNPQIRCTRAMQTFKTRKIFTNKRLKFKIL